MDTASCQSTFVYYDTNISNFLTLLIQPSTTQIILMDRQTDITIWAPSNENVSSGVCDQLRFKPACAATETSQNLEILDLETRDIILSKEQTTKALIRLRGCAGWSAPLLFAYGIRHIFAWPGPFVFIQIYMWLLSQEKSPLRI